MLINENDFSVKEFLELFNKKFSNFASKSPVLISFKVIGSVVIIKEESSGKSLEFNFDFSKSVKQNIKEIKIWLVENCYPVMVQRKKEYSDYTIEEVDKIIADSGISPTQAVMMKKETVTVIKHRIEKILVKKDELFVRNMTTDKQYRYKLLFPSTLLLKKMRESWTPEYAYQVFQKKSVFLNEIYPTIEDEE